MIGGEAIDWARMMRQPGVVHEMTDVLKVMEMLRRLPVQMAMVIDEYGSLEGIATPTDVLEAIAGEFPDLDEAAAALERQEDGSWTVDAFIDIRQLSTAIGHDLVDDANRYSTLAGYILSQLGHLPKAGDVLETEDLRFEVLSLEKRAIGKVRISPRDPSATAQE